MADCDVLVVGGGPGGSACALELARRSTLSVVLLEASHYATPRIGETLSGGSREVLSHLGLTWDDDEEGRLPAFGSAAAWGGPELATRDFLLTPHGPGWHLDRRAFDAGLASAAASAGARVRVGSRVVRVVEEGEGWVARVRDADGERDLSARFVVDATGRGARVARAAGAEQHHLDRQIGIAWTFRLPPDHQVEYTTVVEAFECGWAYTAPVPGDRLVAVLMTDPDLARARRLARPEEWRNAFTALPHSAARLRDGHPTTSAPTVVGAQSRCLTRSAGRSWVAVGDASTSHDPLSSTGITSALESGIRGAHAVAATLGGADEFALARYDRAQGAAFDRYCATRHGYYGVERRWSGSPYWSRRRRSVTLDPHARIGPARAADPDRLPRLPADLRHVDGTRLMTAVGAGARPAHEVLAAYRRAEGDIGTVSDLDLVLGLQWMVGTGALTQTR